jgi:hypothetical protein
MPSGGPAPAGWNNPASEKIVWYAESNGTGLGASPGTRVPRSHQQTTTEIEIFPETFLQGTDDWRPGEEAATLS